MQTLAEHGQSSFPNWAKDATCNMVSGEGEFDLFWPQVERLLDARPELWNRAFTKETLFEWIMSNRMQLWVVHTKNVVRLAMLTQFYVTPTSNVGQVWWAQGEGLRAMLPMLSLMLEKFAGERGATRVEVVGRKGLEKVLAPLGFEFESATYSRKIRHFAEH